MAQPRQMDRFDRSPRSAKEIARQRTDDMDRELGLSKRQSKDLYDLHYKAAKQWQEARGVRGGDREAMRRKMQLDRNEMMMHYRRILTAAQWDKWERITAKRRSEFKGKDDDRRVHGQRPPQMMGKSPRKAPMKPHDKGREPMHKGGKK